jgi:hypothetical protein
MEHQEGGPSSVLRNLISPYVVPRRLEDRIRALSNRALSTTEPGELNAVHQQLRALLREHMARLRELVTANPARPERRRRA